MFGLFFVLKFVKLSVGNVFHTECVIFFASFYLWVFQSSLGTSLIESTCLKESTFTNKGQREMKQFAKLKCLMCYTEFLMNRSQWCLVSSFYQVFVRFLLGLRY